MTSEDSKPKTIKNWVILSILLSVTLIIIILYLTTDTETLKELNSRTIRYEFFIGAFCLNILYWILWGARLQILSDAVNKSVHISWLESTKIVIANLFLAGITPSMAGGEPVRIYLLNKDGLSIGESTAAVLGERLIDAIFILLCVPFAFFIFRSRIHSDALQIGISVGIIVFAVGLLLFAYGLKNPKKIKDLLLFFNKKLSRFSKKKDDEKDSLVLRINREVDRFHCGMVFFLREGKGAFLKATIVSVLFWSTGFLIPSMILLGLGFNPFFIESYAAQVLLLVIVMMPTTPGSSGVCEIGVTGLYSVLIGTNLIGVFVLIFRLITFHMNLIAGGIFQYKIFKSIASFSFDTIKQKS